VDDGSAKGPESLLRSVGDPRIRWFKIHHAGKGATLNHGVGQARAETVCFLDQDDIMLPGRLETQLPVFKREDPVDVVYSDYERRHDDGRLIDRFISRQASANEILRSMARKSSFMTMQTLMLRKAAFASVGGFSTDIRLNGLDDLDFFLRLCSRNLKFKYAPGIVQVWSRHEWNFSDSTDFQLSRLRMLDLVAAMSKTCPAIRTEQKYFRFHAFYMRGLYFLENGPYENAWPEFRRALASGVFSLNACYLAAKSLLGWLLKLPRKRAHTISSGRMHGGYDRSHRSGSRNPS
jgi:glycosyltransferase involved in cell wall biosynthesis